MLLKNVADPKVCATNFELISSTFLRSVYFSWNQKLLARTKLLSFRTCCHRYAHAICDRVPVELIEALLEKDLFICRTCRQTKCEKRGVRQKVCVFNEMGFSQI